MKADRSWWFWGHKKTLTTERQSTKFEWLALKTKYEDVFFVAAIYSLGSRQQQIRSITFSECTWRLTITCKLLLTRREQAHFVKGPNGKTSTATPTSAWSGDVLLAVTWWAPHRATAVYWLRPIELWKSAISTSTNLAHAQVTRCPGEILPVSTEFQVS